MEYAIVSRWPATEPDHLVIVAILELCAANLAFIDRMNSCYGAEFSASDVMTISALLFLRGTHHTENREHNQDHHGHGNDPAPVSSTHENRPLCTLPREYECTAHVLQLGVEMSSRQNSTYVTTSLEQHVLKPN